MSQDDPSSICSFCNNESGALVRGQAGAICRPCAEIAICDFQDAEKNEALSGEISPAAIVQYLDQHVIGQDQAKKILAVAAFNHLKRAFSKLRTPVQKSNVWVIGPSGSGKSLLVQKLAQFLDVPFASADATSITESGYVGEDANQMLGRLVQAAEGNIQAAERGIIFIDEIEKLAKTSESSGRDIKGKGVQQSLLKMVEGDTVAFSTTGKKISSNEPMEYIDTRQILFVLAGAFVGIDQQISPRSIGIGQNVEQPAGRPVVHDDLIGYGMIPELVGRIPIIAELSPLTEDQLVRILVEPKESLCGQYEALLAIDGVALKFSDEFLRGIAQRAIKEKTNARGLRALMEKALLSTMFQSGSHTREKGKPPVVRTMTERDLP